MTNDWSSWTAAAFRGASLGVDEWRLDAEFVGVRIVGGLALAGPGTLRSPVSFAKTIRAAMTNAQAPPAVADAATLFASPASVPSRATRCEAAAILSG